MGGTSVCSSCGHRGVGGDFCSNCGMFVAWTRPAEPPTAETAPPDDGSEEVVVDLRAPGTDDVPVASRLDELDQNDAPAPGSADFDDDERGGRLADTTEVPVAGPVTRPAAAVQVEDAPAREAPPVAVAQKPAAAEPRRPFPTPPPAPSAVPPLQPGEQRCPDCGTASGPERRFCRRCGAVLRAGAHATSAPPAPAPWWRRFLPSASRASRQRYRRSLALKHRVLRVAMGVGIVAAIVLALGLLDVGARGWVTDRWHDLRGDRFVAIETAGASVEPVEAQVTNFPPEGAVDGAPGRGWAVAWDPEGAPAEAAGPDCPPSTGNGRAAGVLRVAFADEAQAARLRVLPGSAGDDRTTRPRPADLRLRWDDGTCQTVSVADEPGEQTFGVVAPAASAVEVAVVDVHPAVNSDDPLVVIREIAFDLER